MSRKSTPTFGDDQVGLMQTKRKGNLVSATKFVRTNHYCCFGFIVYCFTKRVELVKFRCS